MLPLSDLQGYEDTLPLSLLCITMILRVRRNFFEITTFPNSGHNYYASFIDAYSRFTWLYLIKHKSAVFDVFIQFQAHVERLLKQKIIHVQSD